MTLPKTYKELRDVVFEEDGSKYPGKTLVNMELVPGYERATKRLLPYIQAINEAHVVMLYEQKILSNTDAKEILKGLANIDMDFYKNSSYNGQFEDLYFYMESNLIKDTNGAAGNMHLARSRNDMCVAWSHMSVRDSLLKIIQKLISFQNAVLLFSEEHKDTLYVIHTHTQHAQPGLLGHYFLGMADMIDRNIKRLCYCYSEVNASPMGAAAVTTSGFPISRERVAELAGFDSVIENAYDAIGNTDYFTQTASALGLCAMDLGRVVTDLVLWATQEMHSVRVADGYISTSSIMPQKRNPIALEHLRASLSVVKGLADTICTGFLKSPYGDISDYEDIEDTIFSCMEKLELNIDLFRAVMATMDVDKELLKERAYESFSVVTEIADEMYRSYKIPFRSAHSFVSKLVKKAEKMNYNLRNISKEFFAETFKEVFGREFTEDFQPILNAVDPWYFVKSRDIYGGTGDNAMASMIANNKEKIQKNCEWLESRCASLMEAEKKRKAAIKAVLDVCS